MAQDLAKPVPLHVAASVVQRQLSSALRQDEAYNAVLDSTALALSNVADIYYVNTRGRIQKIPGEELALGMFEAGAKIFRTRSGNVYQQLSMRRGDMANAIAILSQARSDESRARAGG